MGEEVFGDRFLYPFWFVDPPLLGKFWLAEINTAAQLLADQPNMRVIFDTPDAELLQRKMCFELLAHRKLIEVLDELIAARLETPPPLNDLESRTLDRTCNLVRDDAPEWAREMERVVDRIPFRLVEALPEPLQTEGYYPDTEERHEALRSAAMPLSTVEQLQVLVGTVFDEQLQRLARRWSVAARAISETTHPDHASTRSQRVKSKAPRKRDKQRMSRDKMIFEIDDVTNSVTEFLQLMDERGVKPLPTWPGWPGSWVQAYKIPHLRKLIHQDKSRSIARWNTLHKR